MTSFKVLSVLCDAEDKGHTDSYTPDEGKLWSAFNENAIGNMQ